MITCRRFKDLGFDVQHKSILPGTVSNNKTVDGAAIAPSSHFKICTMYCVYICTLHVLSYFQSVPTQTDLVKRSAHMVQHIGVRTTNKLLNVKPLSTAEIMSGKPKGCVLRMQ